MPPKRKSNDYLKEILEMKKQKIEPALDGKSEKNRPIRNAFFQFKADSAGEMLSKILAEATPDDIIGEYIWFLKNLPNMLNSEQSTIRPCSSYED